MFFNQDDDDQDFLSPTGGSKLASLFGIDQASSQGGNESLTYTAPKEPKKKKPGDAAAEEAASAGPAVLHAVAAHCYKYVEGRYASQGKLGVAVLGNHVAQDYKILLYVSKQKQVTHAHITAAFTLTVLPNNYVSFYDDMRQGWSVMFDSADSAVNFSKQVAVAKANSAGALDMLVSQDLTLGEGGPLESNDSAEIKYTGNLLQNHIIGQEFDSNAGADKLFRFKLGKGKVIKGWEEGVLGMKKLGRRLLVVPPSLGYGSSGMGSRVPPNATLIFEIEVIRVKLAKPYTEPTTTTAESPPEVTSQETGDGPSPEAEAVSTSTTDTECESVKSRTKSISDQLSQNNEAQNERTSKSDKAKLISRMAKMGKPMIPPPGGTATADAEISDDDTADAVNSGEMSPKPVLPPKPTAVAPAPAPTATVLPPQQTPVVDHNVYAAQMTPQQAAMLGQHMAAPAQPQLNQSAVFQGVQMPTQMAVYQSPVQQQPFMNPYQQSQFGFQQQQPYPGGPQQVPTPPPAASDMHTPVLLSEARQQNTEVRLSLGKLQDKVEKIHEKLDHMSSSQSGHGMALGMAGSLPMMETTVLLHSIQRIVQENERLKKEIFDKNSRIESQNDKISDLLQRNQKYMEQSNDMLEQRNDSFKNTAAQSQTRLLQLEQERVQLVTELATERSQVGTLQLEVANVKKREMDLRSQLESLVSSSESHREDVSGLRVDKADLTGRLEQLTSSLKEERLNRKQLENQLSSVHEDLADLKVTNENLHKNLAERKKKAITEKKRLEEEIEELKSQHEEEISSLKEKLRKQKSSIDATASEQVAEAEEDLHREWKEKCERLLASAQEKHQRALGDLEEEKQRVEEQLILMEKKAEQAKSAKGDTNKQVEQLQTEVDSLKAWKDKYENLRSQAASMKERYEERITDLETEKEKIISDAQEAINKARAGGAAGAQSKGALVAEVKKIMNSVYHELKSEFTAEKSYKGSEIHGVILNTVKSTTMKMVRAQEEEESSEEEEEDEEDEESEGESEVPESEGEEKDENQANPQITSSVKVQQEQQNLSDARTAVAVKGEVQYVQNTLQDEVDSGKGVKGSAEKEGLPAGQAESRIMEQGHESKSTSEVTAVQENTLQSQGGIVNKKGDVAGGQVEEMEVAHVSSSVSAPPKAAAAKKDDKPAKAGGFSLAGLEASIITGDEIPSDDKNKQAQSPAKKKSKTDSKTVPEVAMVTGDKGNPYYAEELRKAAEAAKAEQAKTGAGKSKELSKEPKVDPVVAPITGDKGNPYYAEELRKAAEAAKAAKGTPEKSEQVKPVSVTNTAAPPSKVEKPVTIQTTAAAVPPAKDTSKDTKDTKDLVKEAKDKVVKAAVCGDKGNPYYAEELKKAAEAAKDKAAKEKPEVAPVTGDKGNPYYAAELAGKKIEDKRPEAPKRSEAEVLAGIEASMMGIAGMIVKTGDAQKKKEKDSDNKSQKEKKDVKEKSKEEKSKAGADKKASTGSATKGPLFDDDDDLFAAKPDKKDQKAEKKTDAKKPAAAKDAKKGSDSEDDPRKPPPPPLFGDDDDDDDWLS